MSDEIDYEYAKAQFDYWTDFMKDEQESDPKLYAFQYKKGREPDVVGYLWLTQEERDRIKH